MATPSVTTPTVAPTTSWQQNANQSLGMPVNTPATTIGQNVNASLGMPPATPPGKSTTAQTTPIISANSAIQDWNNKQAKTNQISQSVQSQAQTVAQNNAQTQQNAKANTQGTGTQNGDNQSANGSQSGSNQTNTGQNGAQTPADNSDLTGALNSATAALNAGNNITPPDSDSFNANQTQLTQEEQDTQTKLSDINDQITQASNTFQSNMTSLMNGTFPLTASQQSLINQSQSALTQLIQATTAAGQNYINGVKAFGVSAGASMYTPLQYLAQINDATNDANAKVAQVELDGTKALATLQQSFETEDSDLMTKSYDALQTSLDAKQKTLEDMSNQIQASIKDAQDEYNTQVTQYNTQVQNAVGNAFKADTLNETQKKDVFDEAMQSAQFTEKQKMDMQTVWYQQQTVSQNNAKIAQGQENINLKIQALNQTQDADNLAIGGSVAKTGSGKSYVDGSNLTPAAMTKAVEQGFPVLPKNIAPSMNQVTNVQGEYKNLLTSLQGAGLINQLGQFTLPTNGIGNGPLVDSLNSTNATNVTNALNEFTTNVKNMISELQKLPDTGDLVEALQSNEFNTGTIKGDNPQELQTKFTNIGSALDQSEKTLLGQAIQPAPAGQTLLFTDSDEPVFVPNGNVDAFIKAGGHQ